MSKPGKKLVEAAKLYRDKFKQESSKQERVNLFDKQRLIGG